MTKSYSSYKELCFLLGMKVTEARKLHFTLSDLKQYLYLETRDYTELLNEQVLKYIYN